MQTDAIIVFFLIFLFFNTKRWNWKFCYHLAHQTTFFYFVVKIAISNDVVKQNKIFSSIFNHSSCKKAILWRLRCFRWFRFEFKFSQSSHGRRRCEIFPFLSYFFQTETPFDLLTCKSSLKCNRSVKSSDNFRLQKGSFFSTIFFVSSIFLQVLTISQRKIKAIYDWYPMMTIIITIIMLMMFVLEKLTPLSKLFSYLFSKFMSFSFLDFSLFERQTTLTRSFNSNANRDKILFTSLFLQIFIAN